MKKFLLSAVAVVCATSLAFADTTTINFSNFNEGDVEGTFVEKELKDDGSVKAWDHWQPLESLTIDGYEFDFGSTADAKTQPALYNSSKGTYTVRLYAGNTMTIMAPEGKTFKQLVFKSTNGKADYTCTTNVGAAKMNFTSDTNQNLTWTSDEAVSSLTMTSNGTIRFESVEISTEASSTPVTPPVTGGDVILNFTNVNKDDVEGTFVEKTLKDDGSVNAWDHWQPLEGFTLEGYEFNFGSTADAKTEPALYNSSKGTLTVRLYAGNTMTIMAPEGKTFKQLVFKSTNGKADYTCTTNVGTAKMNYTSDTNQNLTWTSDEAVSSLTLTSNGTIRFESVEVKSEGGSTPVTPTIPAMWSSLGVADTECDWTFDNIELPEGLDYIWAWKEYKGEYYLNGSAYKDGAVAAEAIAASPVVDLAGFGSGYVSFDHAAKFQTTLKELCSFLIREEGGEWEELAIPTWPTAGAWTFVNSGDINISDYADKKVQFGFRYGSTATGADTWEIRNFNVYSTASVDAAFDNENAVPVYFDMTGRRVNGEPKQGLYIKVVGNKATKIFVR